MLLLNISAPTQCQPQYSCLSKGYADGKYSSRSEVKKLDKFKRWVIACVRIQILTIRIEDFSLHPLTTLTYPYQKIV